MFPFTNSIKATRLWHLTGKQHFKSIVEDRLSVRRIDLQHDKKNFATICGIALLSALAVKYSFGLFKPEKYVSPYTDPVNIDKRLLCTEATKTPCPHTPIDFLPPCPCRDICGEEKPDEKKLIKKAKKERFIKQKQLSREFYRKKKEEEEKEKNRLQEIEEKRKKRLAEGRKPCDCD